MKRKYGPVYKPSGAYRSIVVVAAAIFVGVCVGLVVTGAGTLWVTAGAVMVGISALGVAEVFVTEVVLTGEELTIRRLFTRRSYAVADLTDARIDGSVMAVRVEGGEWVQLPDWLSGGQLMSLRKLLGRRIAAEALSSDPVLTP